MCVTLTKYFPPLCARPLSESLHSPPRQCDWNSAEQISAPVSARIVSRQRPLRRGPSRISNTSGRLRRTRTCCTAAYAACVKASHRGREHFVRPVSKCSTSSAAFKIASPHVTPGPLHFLLACIHHTSARTSARPTDRPTQASKTVSS